MEKISKVKSIAVILVLLLALIYLLSNRTKNVFEEIYYSECPSIIKKGVTNTSLLGVRECYRGNRTLEQDFGQTIYKIELFNNMNATIYIEENNFLEFDTFLQNKDYYMCVFCKYNLQEKTLYLTTVLDDRITDKSVSNVEEVLPQLLSEHGIEASTLNEVSDIILEEFLRQWFEGNSMSKFSMEDLGDFEIVYE